MALYPNVAAAAADGLLTYLPFDEEFGNAVDDKMASGTQSLDCNVSNDVNDLTIIDGKLNKARDFGQNGALPFITQANSDITSYSTFSISFWLNIGTAPSGWITLLVFGSGNPTYFRVSSGGFLQAIASGNAILSSASIADGQWHHIVYTASFDNFRLTIDNVFQDDYTTGGTPGLAPWNSVSICDADIDAAIDDLGLWDNVISSGDISTIWNGGTGLALVNIPYKAKATIEFIIKDSYSASTTLEFNIAQRTVKAKAFLEMKRYTTERAAATLEFNIKEPTARAVATLSMQVYDKVKAAAPIQFNVFDPQATSSTVWRPIVILDGVDISERLTGAVDIKLNVNAANVASFVMVPEPGPVDIFGYVGNTVEIRYYDINKELLKYVGFVDKPSYSPDANKINFSCTNDPQGRISKMSRAQIDDFLQGLWSPHVFDENASNWAYFNDQLSTVEASFWIDDAGIMRLTNWDTSVVDYQYDNSSKVFESIRIINPDKGDIINRIEITLDFRYSNYIQRNVFYDSAYQYGLCHFLDDNTFILPTRDLIERAADGAGWVRMGAIAYKPVWEPTNRTATGTIEGGWYETGTVQCNGETKGWAGDPGEEEPEFCIGASFTLCKRWTRSTTETYTLLIEAPESITANGVRGVKESYGINAESDEDEWEANYTPLEVIRDVPGNTTTIGLSLVMPPGSVELENGDWMFPEDQAQSTGRTAMEYAQETAMTKARVEILNGHRSRDIVFTVPLDPFVNLGHTVRLDTDTVQATGKLRSIRHIMDIDTERATTELTLASSGSGTSGLVVDTPIVPIQAEPSYPLGEYDRYVWLPWRLGGRLSSPPYNEEWTGYTSNYEYDPDDNSRPDPFSPFDAYSERPDINAYPRQFAVQTPDIEEGDRVSETAAADELIIVNIPIDELNEVAQ